MSGRLILSATFRKPVERALVAGLPPATSTFQLLTTFLK